MTIQTITVQLPMGLYNRLQRRAEQAHRSIEMEMVETVADALPADDALPPELAAAVAQLAAADDDTLWRMVQAQFPAEKSAQLETLHLRRQARAWRAGEARQADELTAALEQFMFLRAQAMALLLQRGYDMTALTAG